MKPGESTLWRNACGMHYLPANLRYYRVALGLSFQQVADKLDVNRSLIYQYEIDIRTPNVERLRQLADVYSVTVEQLCEERMT